MFPKELKLSNKVGVTITPDWQIYQSINHALHKFQFAEKSQKLDIPQFCKVIMLNMIVVHRNVNSEVSGSMG